MMIHDGETWVCGGPCDNYLQVGIENSYSLPKGESFDVSVTLIADETFVNSFRRCSDEDPLAGICTADCSSSEGDCNGFTLYCPEHPGMLTGGACTLTVSLSLSLSLSFSLSPALLPRDV